MHVFTAKLFISLNVETQIVINGGMEKRVIELYNARFSFKKVKYNRNEPRTLSEGRGVAVQWVKLPHGMPVSPTKEPVCVLAAALLAQLPVNTPGK